MTVIQQRFFSGYKLSLLLMCNLYTASLVYVRPNLQLALTMYYNPMLRLGAVSIVATTDHFLDQLS